jgi:ABC-type multidrug transport system fused ATPase/permease subunit
VKDFAEVENLWDFFDNTPQIQWYEEWKTFIYKNGDIHIQNISYSYENSSPVFQNFSLDIPGSKITALVWPSGGGKSTLVKLISGYIRQDSGDIIVDTQNLRDTSLKSYYADVWYLTQEPSVFDGTVEENLLYAVTQKPSENQIKKIIKLAHCDFIYDLPEGLQTEIGERGIKLSGGQKQRLAIAKIFLKDPKIIILDEPTSALDSLSEQKITEAMHNLFEGRTVIIIAHRLQTVKHADDIIVIESGSIIERGTHASLVRKKWYYKEMLDLQSGF